MMINEQVLAEIVKRLTTNFQPYQIILFGSQARQTADARSDVDILVICPIKGNRRALMVSMDISLEGLGIARDIVILSPEEFEIDRQIPGTVARTAWKEGRVLYERS
ncbi:MAG: nucleotidyltransferase domain-containing protein [Nitrospirota bacterium]